MFTPKNSLAEKISDTKSKVDKVLKEDLGIAIGAAIVGIIIFMPVWSAFEAFLDKAGREYRSKTTELRRDLLNKVKKLYLDYFDDKKIFPPLNNILNILDKNPDKKIVLEKWNEFLKLYSSLNNNFISDLQTLLTDHPLTKRWFISFSDKKQIADLRKQLDVLKDENTKFLNELNSEVLDYMNNSNWITEMITFIKELIISFQEFKSEMSREYNL